MEVWPSGLAVQAGSPNHREPRWSRADVVSVPGKGPAGPGQVCDGKTNVCEPLLTHREKQTMASKLRVGPGPQDKGALLGVPSARELPVCGPGGARCIGGVSPSWALAWKRRTCRLDTDDRHKWVKVAPRSREGGPQAVSTVRGRVPMRGTGAERPVLAMKAL